MDGLPLFERERKFFEEQIDPLCKGLALSRLLLVRFAWSAFMDFVGSAIVTLFIWVSIEFPGEIHPPVHRSCMRQVSKLLSLYTGVHLNIGIHFPEKADPESKISRFWMYTDAIQRREMLDSAGLLNYQTM